MPILVFTLDRSSCSRWSDLSVHLGPKRATVSRYPFYAGSVASVVRGPWARWVWTNSSKSARVGSLSSTRRVRPYRPQTTELTQGRLETTASLHSSFSRMLEKPLNGCDKVFHLDWLALVRVKSCVRDPPPILGHHGRGHGHDGNLSSRLLGSQLS